MRAGPSTIMADTTRDGAGSSNHDDLHQPLLGTDDDEDYLVVGTAVQEESSQRTNTVRPQDAELNCRGIVVLDDSTMENDDNGMTPQVRRILKELEQASRMLFLGGVIAYMDGWLMMMLNFGHPDGPMPLECIDCHPSPVRSWSGTVDMLETIYLLLLVVLVIATTNFVKLLQSLYKERPDLFPRFRRSTPIVLVAPRVLYGNMRADLGELVRSIRNPDTCCVPEDNEEEMLQDEEQENDEETPE